MPVQRAGVPGQPGGDGQRADGRRSAAVRLGATAAAGVPRSPGPASRRRCRSPGSPASARAAISGCWATSRPPMLVVAYGDAGGSNMGGYQFLYHVNSAGQATEYGSGNLSQATQPLTSRRHLRGLHRQPGGQRDPLQHVLTVWRHVPLPRRLGAGHGEPARSPSRKRPPAAAPTGGWCRACGSTGPGPRTYRWSPTSAPATRIPRPAGAPCSRRRRAGRVQAVRRHLGAGRARRLRCRIRPGRLAGREVRRHHGELFRPGNPDHLRRTGTAPVTVPYVTAPGIAYAYALRLGARCRPTRRHRHSQPPPLVPCGPARAALRRPQRPDSAT